MVAAWSARCEQHKASTCVNSPEQSPYINEIGATGPTKIPAIYAYTDITYLLHKSKVSWGYYVETGTQPDCTDNAATCPPVSQNSTTPGIWNPLPNFDTVKADRQLANIQDTANFYTQAKGGTLPSVSWVVPSYAQSEHAPASVSMGQSYVTSLINAVMSGPNWDSSAIFVAWDDWGGFYDHVVPRKVDLNGYGLRVPGLMISPYAKHGYIDHQTLSFDAYLKFIEDVFLGGQRLNPANDGRPDPRPTVRENVGVLGDLTSEFDFSQPPRSPVLLPVYPVTTLTSVPPFEPIITNTVPGEASARVTLINPKSNGGSPITTYRITPFQNGKAESARVFTYTAARVHTYPIAGLKNGGHYTFAVQAVNAIGTSEPAMSPAIVAGSPLSPSAVNAVPSRNRPHGQAQVVVQWSQPPSNNGSTVTGYVIRTYDGSGYKGQVLASASARSFTIRHLHNGHPYSFGIAAKNARGTGVFRVTQSVTPR
jgi:hypothetical protein